MSGCISYGVCVFPGSTDPNSPAPNPGSFLFFFFSIQMPFTCSQSRLTDICAESEVETRAFLAIEGNTEALTVFFHTYLDFC